jgi:hypothetical protein
MTDTTKTTADATTNATGKVQGEGDYEAARRFQEAERSWVEKGPVERKAKEAAAALDGPEGAELERARRETGEGVTHHTAKVDADRQPDASDPHTEHNLDKGLDETFPASDPVSIHPGAD